MSDRVLMIAEAGVNHNGSLQAAKALVDAAAAAGADMVKFQTFRADALVSKGAAKADYQTQTTAADESQYDMIKKLELTDAMHRGLIQYCGEKGIDFLSTPFDLDSIDYLASLGITLWKIPSGEITNLPFLRKIGALGQDVILSTGMSDLDEVATALHVLESAGLERASITLLHCNTEYPTPMKDVNLRAMETLREAFPGLKGVGYSDHTRGIEIPTAAVALGATVIEKHFTLDRTMPGPDHAASLEPQELTHMICAIRNIESALGHGKKIPSPSELKNQPIARKSIVAAHAIAAGETFTEENLTVKRPGTGISPMQWDNIIGETAARNYSPDELIEP